MKAAVLGAFLLAGCQGIAEAPIAPPAPGMYRAHVGCADGVPVAIVFETTGPGVVRLDLAEACAEDAPIKPSRGT